MWCRGMRLSDTIFLTLTICLLQVYIGMRCLYEVHLPEMSPPALVFSHRTIASSQYNMADMHYCVTHARQAAVSRAES